MFHVKQNIKMKIIESIKKFKIKSLRSSIYIATAVCIIIGKTVYIRYFLIAFVFIFLKELLTNLRQAKKEKIDLTHYYLTNTLVILNPFIFLGSLKHIFGQLYILLKNYKGFPNAEIYQNKATYILPFKEEWNIVNGGITPETSHSWDVFTQRYAYDFAITQNDKSYQNDGKQLTDYYCYGKEVISPADGVVVGVNNNTKDYTGVGDYSVDWRAIHIGGNFVVIKHEENEYSFTAHLKKDSILVKVGEKVKQGQTIGLCGNSGNSTEPHIHFHLQDGKNFWTATGLPIRFCDFSIRENENKEKIATSSGFIEKGNLISNT